MSMIAPVRSSEHKSLPVEARSDGILCRNGVFLRIQSDFAEAQWARLGVTLELDVTGTDDIERPVGLLLEDVCMSSAPECPKLGEDERSVGVNGICNLFAHGDEHSFALSEATGTSQLTFRQACTWSSFQRPGTFLYPPASGAMKVASVMRSVPGVDDRCL